MERRSQSAPRRGRKGREHAYVVSRKPGTVQTKPTRLPSVIPEREGHPKNPRRDQVTYMKAPHDRAQPETVSPKETCGYPFGGYWTRTVTIGGARKSLPCMQRWVKGLPARDLLISRSVQA